MITKITNTPSNLAVANFYAKNECCKPRKNVPAFNTGLAADTVTFTSSQKQVDDVVQYAFSKLANSRQGNKLGTVIGTTSDKVDVVLRETVFGKNAELTLHNLKGKGDDNFAIFELSRSNEKPSKIISITNDKANANTTEIVKQHLEDLK